MNKIEVCLSPKLLDRFNLDNKIVVVVDILRATTIITTMFHNGLTKLIPVKSLDEARKYKDQGFLVAAERNGKKVDFADFDNSPFTFSGDKISGKTLVYSTTNGTNTINLVKHAEKVIMASFLNLTSIAEYLTNQQKNILILCSGWQGNYCTEDALFAGCLSEKLIQSNFIYNEDTVSTAIELWQNAKNNLQEYIKNIFQYKRLIEFGFKDIVEYCFQTDITLAIPILKDDYISDLLKIT